MKGDAARAQRALAEGGGHEGLSPTLVAWLSTEPLATGTVLDVGTGTGRLALALAPKARRVLGIDTDAGALVEARRRARRAGVGNVLFVVGDAERVDYRTLGRPDLVVAHLCMSDAIIERAAAGVSRGSVLAFAAFHVDQWQETGRVSRFAYDEERARAALETAGFRVEDLEVERDVARFESAESALQATARFRPKWEADGRWPAWERFLAEGGRTLTESRLVIRARREERS
ncbi:MAG TPA: class I SAM-dependent methyltransferase [Methylomirabilota bacterium]|jgi:SAM-dependent methyltransferase|nr:class I SAM-dependent methyltransferase [Methylomirabilota bacterium]